MASTGFCKGNSVLGYLAVCLRNIFPLGHEVSQINMVLEGRLWNIIQDGKAGVN